MKKYFLLLILFVSLASSFVPYVYSCVGKDKQLCIDPCEQCLWCENTSTCSVSSESKCSSGWISGNHDECFAQYIILILFLVCFIIAIISIFLFFVFACLAMIYFSICE